MINITAVWKLNRIVFTNLLNYWIFKTGFEECDFCKWKKYYLSSFALVSAASSFFILATCREKIEVTTLTQYLKKTIISHMRENCGRVLSIKECTSVSSKGKKNSQVIALVFASVLQSCMSKVATAISLLQSSLFRRKRPMSNGNTKPSREPGRWQ